MYFECHELGVQMNARNVIQFSCLECRHKISSVNAVKATKNMIIKNSYRQKPFCNEIWRKRNNRRPSNPIRNCIQKRIKSINTFRRSFLYIFTREIRSANGKSKRWEKERESNVSESSEFKHYVLTFELINASMSMNPSGDDDDKRPFMIRFACQKREAHQMATNTQEASRNNNS